MKSLLFLFLVSFVQDCLSFQATTNHKIKVKQRVIPPQGWKVLGPPLSDHRIDLRIGLAQPNVHLLEQHLLEISLPNHPRYGQHLSKEDVETLVAPRPESIRLVDEWLSSYGIQTEVVSRSPAQDWIMVSVPVDVAEKLLNTTYYTWKHVESGHIIVRTTSYSLPEHLHSHVDVLQPTTAFARWGAMRSTVYKPSHRLDREKTGGGGCNAEITIDCLRDLYNTKGYQVQKPKENSIAITGYGGQFANNNDLQSFYKEQRPDAVGSNFDFVSVNGGNNSQEASEAGLEANLDVQYAFGLAYPTRSIFYSTGGRPPFKPGVRTPENTNEPYAEWLSFILSEPNPPLVVSTSYGDDEQTVPEDYARRTCQEFMQLGARGVSLIFASGDGGVGDGSSDPRKHKCVSNDGRNKTEFLPIFPASCPYVTAVGGTANVPESGAPISGGGFSNYFERPAYQSMAVEEYLGHLPNGLYSGLFNSAGRAIPDVATQSLNFRVYVSGDVTAASGTSASAPTFAAIVALLNDARLAKGLSPLGFLNPLLYSQRVGALNDVIVGNNPGCGTPGFNATPGWDPVTGLGTPDFQKLKDVVLGG